jgi:formylglycine-generating enzyme
MTAGAAILLLFGGACSASGGGGTNERDASVAPDAPVDGVADGRPRDAPRDGSGDAPRDASGDAPRDASAEGASDAGQDAGCAPTTQRCSGGTAIQTCDSPGLWGDTWPCASGVCSGGACTQPAGLDAASCASGGDGLTNCGEAGTESCCASLEVNGGTYYRSYASEADGGGAIGEGYPATVSGFRLDRYDVTVGRFRQFVGVVRHGDGGAFDAGPLDGGSSDGGSPDGGMFDNGWVPDAGSGKHVQLNDGSGLVNAGSAGGFETGWVSTDDSNIAPSDSNLASCAPFSTWTNAPGPQENLPINCVNWYEAYAFCIWDGGFLPSEAEWEFAAAGGGGPTGQREYPWGAAAPGVASQYAIYDCYYPSASDGGCTGPANVAPVGSAPLGTGAWGQMDLGGEVYQWNLDWYMTPFTDPCVDCAYLTPTSGGRIIHGGDFYHSAALMLPTALFDLSPAGRNEFVGFRCARTP